MRARCNVSRRQRSEAAEEAVLRGLSIAATAGGGPDESVGVCGGSESVGGDAYRSTAHGARTRGRPRPRMALGLAVALLVTLLGVRGSEFPERECCDPVYPPMPDPDPVPPGAAHPTTTISSSSSFQTGQTGEEGGRGRDSGTALGGGDHGGGAGGPAGTGPGNHPSSSRPMHIGYSGEFSTNEGSLGNGFALLAGGG
ncbi:hypothetical protein ZHAS_00009015 [Anopheles sinensis]|uniref:Uncharacterized protein n=1 Tax=Anopheles sinensis TaxID=74873 RepID=A0A084VTY6_ANOSI|nr:hypothetical protein ZHAS_00009015 [Anopheles sinensis]